MEGCPSSGMALHTIESHCCNKTVFINVDKQKRVLTVLLAGNVDEVVSGAAGSRLTPRAWSFVSPSFLSRCHPQGASVSPSSPGFVLRSR